MIHELTEGTVRRIALLLMSPVVIVATTAAAVIGVTVFERGADDATVTASGATSTQRERLDAPSTTTVSDRALARGARGPAVRALQMRLVALGYWLGAPDGHYGWLTEQAVVAFQKASGLPRTGRVEPAAGAALASAERPRAGAAGDYIEIDKSRQLLLIVRDGRVAWALNTSTGTEKPYRYRSQTLLADTPPGRWTITWAYDGVREGALGQLYRPRYFHRDGIAIHGSLDVPAYAASHGCARVSDAAIDWIWRTNLAPIGSTVWVHG